MNFEFSEEQLMIQQAARDYAQRELIKDVIERDESAEFPTEHIKNLAELGFLGMLVGEEWDGGGMDTVSYVLAMEEISKVDSSVSVVMSVNNSLVCYGLEKFGNDQQREKYLKPLARGEKIGAFLLSEPEAGSDATKQRTTAKDMGDYYLVNGTKNWITNGNSASTYIVIAHTSPEKGHRGINAFIVEKDSEGITIGPHENKMGMRSSDTHS
ncbi:MAG: acyl-CoA dehydrogenase, partial [Bacteroidales bacterium]|nr:acyl-CoA dehydrogenase [Bacteroidales bacterium]